MCGRDRPTGLRDEFERTLKLGVSSAKRFDLDSKVVELGAHVRVAYVLGGRP